MIPVQSKADEVSTLVLEQTVNSEGAGTLFWRARLRHPLCAAFLGLRGQDFHYVPQNISSF